MTVTVTKSEINVRDTLTRLDSPTGVFGAQLAATNNITDLYTIANPVMFRNRIINGDMRIDQRNAGNSVTTSALQQGIYTIDRWNYYNDVISKRTIQQSSVAPTGFRNSLKVTVIATDIVGPQQFLRHTIEGYNLADLNWGTSSAQPAVLSFWVRSSVVGQHGGAIQSSNTDWCFPFAYYITAVDTWEYKTIQISAATTGSWGSTNGYGAAIQFEHGVGYQKSPANVWIALNATSSTGSVNLCATNGATWYITGVQFEKGTQATPFEFRPYPVELVLCQRYCYVWSAATNGASYAQNVVAYQATNAMGVIPMPVTMRANPTLATTGNPANYKFYIGSNSYICTAVPFIDQSNTQSLNMFWPYSTGGLSVGQGGIAGTAASTATFLAFSAEL